MSPKSNLALSQKERSLKWVGAWTPKMTKAGFKFDPDSRKLDSKQAVSFVKMVMKPGFMVESYQPKPLNKKENEEVRDQVKNLIKEGKEFNLSGGQRAFDAMSSFDLRKMVNNYYHYDNLKQLKPSDLTDPEMKVFKGMPGVAVVGIGSFPEFKVTLLDDSEKIEYAAPGFMTETILTSRDDSYKEINGVSYIKRSGKKPEMIDQRHAFNRVFAEHNLFGYRIEMANFDPLTALGGMGLSNHAVMWALTAASILANAQKDEGQLFAEGGYIENRHFNGETGFQEMIQAIFPGSGMIIYAYNYFGGIGRQLLSSSYSKEIEKNMKLILYNRVSGEKRLPVNETWAEQAAHPDFRDVYQHMLDIASEYEAWPFVIASAKGRPINFNKIRKGYLEHAWLRYYACQQYFGNEQEKEFIINQIKKGNAVFPLGEGSNNSTKLFIAGKNFNQKEFDRIFPILKRKDALDALRKEGTITTGQIKYKMLNERYKLGDGFSKIHGEESVPKPLITII
jgi:hypothetical protein